MTVKFKKWDNRKSYYDDLMDITSEAYPELTNKEVEEEIDRLLKNAWISRRVEVKLLELRQKMDRSKPFCMKNNILK